MDSVILIVLDGFGIAPPGPGNAVYLAHPKNFASFLYSFPNTTLKASGEAVGLPAGEVGNTEVGHLNLGAGKIIYQNLPRINMSIADGSFYQNPAFLDALNHVKNNNGKLHIMGLVGVGSVHASVEHLYALLFFCKEHSFKNVFIHAIADGRDSPPKAAKLYLTELQERLSSLGFGQIASVAGRYYSMDRDKRWERTEKSYVALTQGIGEKVSSWEEAIDNSYKESKTDEFIEPTLICNEGGQPKALIQKGDAVIFYNYRIDRPRQLTKAFVLDNFAAEANKVSYDPYATKYFKKHEVDETVLGQPFTRGKKIENLYFATMTEYEKGLATVVAFPPRIVNLPLGRILSEHEIAQLRLAESEKERFVTFYFNGLREIKFALEDHLIVPSPKVPTYDLKPEMSSYELTDLLTKKIAEQKYRFILINFASADMVGHTGNLAASISAIGALDECLGKIADTALKYQDTILITADHGNIEEMINLQTGDVSTEHSANVVPFIAINQKLQGKPIKLQSGILADVAPTILALLGIGKPTEMTGRNLLEEVS